MSITMHSEFLFFFVLWLAVAFAAAAVNRTETKPGCPSKCGNVNIPYPFGVGEKCSISSWANINCNTTFNPPKPFLYEALEVLQLSPTEVRVLNGFRAYSCYQESGELGDSRTYWFTLRGTPYTISSTKNRIKAIGCDAFSQTYLNSDNLTSGCQSNCNKIEDVVMDPCTGSGCCEMPVPKGLQYFKAVVSGNNTKVWSFNPCNGAFIGEEGTYRLTISDLSNSGSLGEIPVVLNFGVGNQTCKLAKQNATDYACTENSYCYDSVDGTGYLCNCSKGYEGNPYLKQSCKDVNECKDPNNNPCYSNCTNTPGSYYCSCPPGYHGDGTKDWTRCTKIVLDKTFPIIQLALGVGLGLLFLLIGGSCLYLSVRKQRQSKIKGKFFEQNGGLLLKQQISSHEGGVQSTKIFTAEELKLATNNYEEHRILGQGGNGTVYKGLLKDKKIVAIKKSKVVGENQVGEFINEVVILTQIHHRNVVKLMGCCLETEVPLLVYEYVSNGTLYDHLHKKGGLPSAISWEDRLRIAAETAGALAYLHSAVSISIIHRDIKSANILLDDHYNAKVADFGASRLNTLDETMISTLVQGTMGYLDPEYFHNGQLTHKSDVYSFGVVLAELITGEKAICLERPEEQKNLATYFLLLLKENRIIRNGGNKEQVLLTADLAKRCLRLKGEDRPSMKEVASELEWLRGMGKISSKQQRKGDRMILACEEVDLYSIPLGSHGADGDSAEHSSQQEMDFSNISR